MFKIPRSVTLTLAGICGLTGGCWWGWTNFVQAPLAQKQKLATTAKNKKDKTQSQVLAARAADADLADYEALCLPGQPSLAQEQFQTELIELFHAAKVGTPTLTPGSPVLRSDVVVVPYTIQGETDQAGLTRLLYEFRKAPRLRQIRRMSLTPIDRGDIPAAIRFSLNIEALGLGEPGVRSPPDSCKPNARPRLEDYAGLMGRAVLSARGPGATELPANAPEFVVLTGIVQTAGKGEASVFDRATGTSRKLRVGDKPGVRDDESVVVRDLGVRDVVLERDGTFFVWQLGTPYQSRQRLSIEGALEREVQKRRDNTLQR